MEPNKANEVVRALRQKRAVDILFLVQEPKGFCEIVRSLESPPKIASETLKTLIGAGMINKAPRLANGPGRKGFNYSLSEKGEHIVYWLGLV